MRLIIILSVCGVLGCSESTPAPLTTATNATIPTKTPILSATITSTLEPSLTPTPIPTPDTWKIQKCHKAPDVLEIDYGNI